MVEIPEVVYQVKQAAEELLQDSILGIYLYGSAVLSGLRVNSDVDILIISSRGLTGEERKRLTEYLMLISGKAGCKKKRPLEVTVINRNDLVPWKFPPKCEYMYGEWLREEMEKGIFPQAMYDPDAAILLWQAGKYSVAVNGKAASYPDASEILPQIPAADIKRAIRDSLPGLLASLKGDERNVLLTLVRMWLTLATGEIRSKDAAAEWAAERLPENISGPLDMARRAYLGECTERWDGLEEETEMLAMVLRDKISSIMV